MGTNLTFSHLLDLSKKMQNLTEEYINNQKASTIITLLIGLTGVGKSTFFNFLSGAEFVSNGKHLELKYTSD